PPAGGVGGGGGGQHTLLFTGTEFRVAYEFPKLFEGVGTENPKLIRENLDQMPFIPVEDIRSGLAAQSVLLVSKRDGYRPFGEEAAKAYTDLGGYSLLFELKNDYKTAVLKSWVNWTRSADYPNNVKGVNYKNLPMKFSPYRIRTLPDTHRFCIKKCWSSILNSHLCSARRWLSSCPQ
ncbi:MAG: hypothetical protein NZL98_10330, partial [Anaerolineales bacterium]|nr:hypothetical protein [Anaerolineales bacterium]